MAYARFARDSDVYVYADMQGGFACERCPGIGKTFRCAMAGEMVTHLLTEHRAKGQRVPEAALEELREEEGVDGPSVEVIVSEDGTCKAEICSKGDGIFRVWLFREVPRDTEYDVEAYWSPAGREAVFADTLERARALAEEALRACTGH